jgi:hypothetical protein
MCGYVKIVWVGVESLVVTFAWFWLEFACAIMSLPLRSTSVDMWRRRCTATDRPKVAYCVSHLV